MFNLAKYYDRIYRDKPYLLEVEDVIPRLVPGQAVLDIGGGTGEHARYLNGRGFPTLVVDKSATMVSIARSKDISAEVLDINYPDELKNNSWHNITMLFHVFNFLPEPWKVFKTLHRVVKKRGRIVFDCWDSSLERKGGWSFKWDGWYTKITYKKWVGSKVGIIFLFPFLWGYEIHNLFVWTRPQITGMLEMTGFKVVEIKQRLSDLLIVAEKI